jgi:cytochrome c oxidase subunit 2
MRDQSTLDPAGRGAEEIADLWWLLFAVSAVVFAVVLVLLLLGALRRRGAPGAGPDRRESRRGNRLVAIAGFGVPAVVVIALFFASVATLQAVAPSSRTARMTIEVVGRQWFWDVYYRDGGVRTSNEIHVPVGEPVELRVRTADVIHSFWVPRLTRKLDMIPGRSASLVIEARNAGIYRGQCAEFCGLQHARMAFLVIAEPPARFGRWLAHEAKPATASGSEAFLGAGCGGCHAVRGTPARSRYGPDLTHLGGRRTIAAGTLPNTRAALARWLRDPQAVKPGNKMPALGLTDRELGRLLDYLERLS